MGVDPEDEGIAQTAGALEDGAAAAAAAEDGDAERGARVGVDLGINAIGVSEDDEVSGGLPEAQGFTAIAGFSGVEQRFIGGEVFGWSGPGMIEVIHGVQVARRRGGHRPGGGAILFAFGCWWPT